MNRTWLTENHTHDNLATKWLLIVSFFLWCISAPSVFNFPIGILLMLSLTKFQLKSNPELKKRSFELSALLTFLALFFFFLQKDTLEKILLFTWFDYFPYYFLPYIFYLLFTPDKDIPKYNVILFVKNYFFSKTQLSTNSLEETFSFPFFSFYTISLWVCIIINNPIFIVAILVLFLVFSYKYLNINQSFNLKHLAIFIVSLVMLGITTIGLYKSIEYTYKNQRDWLSLNSIFDYINQQTDLSDGKTNINSKQNNLFSSINPQSIQMYIRSNQPITYLLTDSFNAFLYEDQYWAQHFKNQFFTKRNMQQLANSFNIIPPEDAPNSFILNKKFEQDIQIDSPPKSDAVIFARLKNKNAQLNLPTNTYFIQNLASENLYYTPFGGTFINNQTIGKIAIEVNFKNQSTIDLPIADDDLRLALAIQSLTDNKTSSFLDRYPKKLLIAIDHIIAKLQLQNKPPSQVARSLYQYFQTYKYTLNTNRDLVSFLTTDQQGHCEYFATATTLILQRLGIPARYATGFNVSEFNPNENMYIVRAKDAHAFTLYWNAGQWHVLDATSSNGAQILNQRNFMDTINDFLDQLQFKLEQSDIIGQIQNLPPSIILFLIGILLALFMYRLRFKSKETNNNMQLYLEFMIFLETHFQFKRQQHEDFLRFATRLTQEYPQLAKLLTPLIEDRKYTLYAPPDSHNRLFEYKHLKQLLIETKTEIKLLYPSSSLRESSQKVNVKS